MKNAKGIRASLRLIRAELDTIDTLLDDEGPPALPPDPHRCPRCGETERTENTSTAALRRRTCLTCGTSWALSPAVLNEENHGEPSRTD